MRRTALIIMMLISSPAFASKECDALKDLALSGIETHFRVLEKHKAYKKWLIWVYEPAYDTCMQDNNKDKTFCEKDARVKAGPVPVAAPNPPHSNLERYATYATIYTAFCKR